MFRIGTFFLRIRCPFLRKHLWHRSIPRSCRCWFLRIKIARAWQRRRSRLPRESINFCPSPRGEFESACVMQIRRKIVSVKFETTRWRALRWDVLFDGFHWHRKFDNSKIWRTWKYLRQCGFTEVDNEIAFYSGKRCNFLQRFFSVRTQIVETLFAYLAESRKYSRENKISKCFAAVNHLFIGTGNNLIIGVASTTFPQSFKSLGISLI